MRYFLIFVLIFLAGNTINASTFSPDSLNYIFTLKDDTRLVGKIIEIDSTDIRIITSSSLDLTLKRNEIKSIEEYDSGVLNLGLYTKDPGNDHLFLFPTARSLPSGTFQLSAFELLFPQLRFGISNYVEGLIGGFFILPVFQAGIKISPVKSENLNLAIGSRHVFSEGGSVSAFFGVGTFSFENISLTAGVGYGSDKLEFNDFPLIILGGELQFSNSMKLISENWILVDIDYTFYSLGIRFFGTKMTCNFGIFFFGVPKHETILLPWIGVSYNF